MPDENTPLPTTYTTTVPEKSSGGKCLLIGCLLLVCCCVTSCAVVLGGFALVGNAILATLPTAGIAFDALCDISVTDLRELYDTKFTASYRERVSFNEFRKLYVENSNVFANCKGELGKFSYGDLVTSQTNYSYSNEKISLSMNWKGKQISIELLLQGGEWLIDRLDIR
jgi:hypothetical protein